MQDDINDGKGVPNSPRSPSTLSVYPMFNLNKPLKPHVGGIDQDFIGVFLLLLQTAANKIHPVIFPIQIPLSYVDQLHRFKPLQRPNYHHVTEVVQTADSKWAGGRCGRVGAA
jgi:hypothetical protein